MAKTAPKLSTNQFNSLQRPTGKSAMGSILPEWKWEPLIDTDLEEWLLCKGESNQQNGDSSLKSYEPELLDGLPEDLYDLGVTENNYWLEEFPLFEEIQPLNDVKIQSEPAVDKENVCSNSSNSFCSDKLPRQPLSAQDLLSVSIENATLVFSSDNLFFIKSDALPEVENHLKMNLELPVDNDPSTEKKWEEMDAVEEIIRNAAMELDPWESDTSRSETSSDSPATFESASSSSSSTVESESDDPEWNPKPNKSSSGQKAKNVRSKSSPKLTSSSRLSRRVETVEDKRLRKKEQNKYAATRYRLKKKAEVSELLKEEEELREKKRKLEEKVEDIGNEIRCLKGLMRDFFKAKGLL